MRLRYLNQSGDTIVEVLIAIAVVSLVLAGAYQTSNHSLKSVRQAQEHTEALKYAESELEQLQSASANPMSNIYTTSSPFHMSSGNAVTPALTTPGSVGYTISDTRAGVAPGPYTFTVTITWASVQGTGNDQVGLTYKVD